MAGDSSYASVSLLLHGDGADGSTTFTDNSPTPKTMTVVGNAKISTAQSKFGGAAMYFAASTDHVYAGSSTGFELGFGVSQELVAFFGVDASDYIASKIRYSLQHAHWYAEQ